MVADGGLFAKIGSKKEQATAARLSHRNVDGPRGSRPENQPPNRSPFCQNSPKTTAETPGKSKNHTEKRPKDRSNVE
jgi:hypothetical protein